VKDSTNGVRVTCGPFTLDAAPVNTVVLGVPPVTVIPPDPVRYVVMTHFDGQWAVSYATGMREE
jgi:hypothetical protein